MEKLIKTCLAGILLLAISCAKESNTIRSFTVTQSTHETLTFAIGQHYGGGIIFYIDSTGQHGLIADTADLPEATWWNPLNGLYTTTGTARGIGKGKANTRKIILSQGDSGIYAARECWRSKRSGYKDWFLPSKDELNELYKQKSLVGGFANVFYWSSSEASSDYAWDQYFYDGHQGRYGKLYPDYVRAVRAF